MARQAVLLCDVCSCYDSEQNRVMTVSVCGPRFDLCADDRVKMLVGLGVDEAKATAYVNDRDVRRTARMNGEDPDAKEAPDPESGLLLVPSLSIEDAIDEVLDGEDVGAQTTRKGRARKPVTS